MFFCQTVSIPHLTLSSSNLHFIHYFSHLLCLSFSLSLSPCWTLCEIYSSQEQLQQGAGVNNLWFNKTYISLAGVLYIPHPSPFGGFIGGLWIAGWFRSPLSCRWPVQATTRSPRRLAWPTKCSSDQGLAGDASAKETQTQYTVKPCLGQVQVIYCSQNELTAHWCWPPC